MRCPSPSGHRWHLQRRSWIPLSSESISNNGLESYCNEVKFTVISKTDLKDTFLMTWSWELLSKQWRVGLYRKNWTTLIIWIALRSVGLWTWRFNNELSAHTRNAYPLKAVETEKALSALVNHELALGYWSGVKHLSKTRVQFQFSGE